MNLQQQPIIAPRTNEVMHLQFTLSDDPNLRGAVEDFERRYILHILQINDGQKSRTAEALGIDRKTLYLKMKKYELC